MNTLGNKKSKFFIVVLQLFFLTSLYSIEQDLDLSRRFINKIQIPEDIGIIKDKFIPTTDEIPGLMVCIQDAHCHYEAQMNISRIVKTLLNDYGFTLVNVEGSSGLIDTAPFSAFKERKVKMEFADYFMKQGKITGPEYLSITEDTEFTIFGIENEDLYAKNYTAFMNTLKYRDRVRAYTSKLLDILNKFKKNIYSEELYDFDTQVRKYQNKDFSFEDFTDIQEKIVEEKKIDTSNFPNFQLQAKTRALENSLDFKKVEEARSNVIDLFNQKFEKQDDELRKIVHQSLAFKMNEIEPQEYYGNLIQTAQKNSLPPESYSLLQSYLLYLESYNKIDKNIILEEISLVTKHIKEVLFQNELQRELDSLFNVIFTLENLFKLEVPRYEFQEFLNNKNEYNFRKTKEFILKNGPKQNIVLGFDLDNDLVENNLIHVIDFYKYAMERDKVLMDNAIQKMKDVPTDRSMIVTGGFHSEGLSDLLRQYNYAYLVVAPRILDPNAETPYLDVMKGQSDSVRGYNGN